MQPRACSGHVKSCAGIARSRQQLTLLGNIAQLGIGAERQLISMSKGHTSTHALPIQRMSNVGLTLRKYLAVFLQRQREPCQFRAIQQHTITTVISKLKIVNKLNNLSAAYPALVCWRIYVKGDRWQYKHILCLCIRLDCSI